MIRHINIRIHGRVHGVFFRANTQKKAISFNLKGFVRNEKDGSVYIEAEGEEEKLKKLLDWCYKGPIFAKVEKVEYSYKNNLKGFDGFEIKYQ